MTHTYYTTNEEVASAYIGILIHQYRHAKESIHQSIDFEFYLDNMEMYDNLLAGTLSYTTKQTMPDDIILRIKRIKEYNARLEAYIHNNPLPHNVRSYLLQSMSIGHWIISKCS